MGSVIAGRLMIDFRTPAPAEQIAIGAAAGLR
jgi:hypothetical protein